MGTLTRKHFVALSEIIRSEAMLTEHVKTTGKHVVAGARHDLLRSLTEAMVDFCYEHSNQDNFNATQFRDACTTLEEY